MKQTKIDFNLDGLEDIKKAVGSTMRARVGLIGGKGALDRGGITQAELGLIQMFGSITNGIPPRDFLLMPIELKKREIIKALGGATSRAAFERGDYKKMFEILGATAVGFVDEAFATGGFGQWAPNAPATIKAKGSDSPEIDTGEMRKSVSFDVVSGAGAAPALAAPANGVP